MGMTINEEQLDLLLEKLTSVKTNHFSLAKFFSSSNELALKYFDELKKINFELDTIEWQEFYIDQCIKELCPDMDFTEAIMFKILPGRCLPIHWNLQNFDIDKTQKFLSIKDFEHGHILLSNNSIQFLRKEKWFQNKVSDFCWITNFGTNPFWVLRIVQ